MEKIDKADEKQDGRTLTNRDFASLATARSGMYEFLAGLCAKPTAASVETMLQHTLNLPKGGGVPADLRTALEGFHSSRPDFSKDNMELNLQVEWTRLFRGVAKGYSPPPPYESVYKEGMLGGPTTASITQLYAKNGVGLSNKSTEMADYIGVEFKFMSALASKEAAAWSTESSKALELIQTQRKFAAEHLKPWVPRFCTNAKRLAKTDYYRAAIELIRTISEWDSSLLEGIEVTAYSPA